MKSGQIQVQTENIFPIIKKFLYSDHEIFLRELVSNAVDATSKLKVLQGLGDFKGELGNAKVEIILDETAKTLTIRDSGIGMTEDEIDKYINQIAFSGAEEFVEKYKGKEGAESIIGHFGLGFYSAFMVADKVQINTLSYKEGAQAIVWESNGSPEYTITNSSKSERGTDIVLFIAEDSKEFLEKARIENILNKYCKFLPVPVVFGTKKTWEDNPEGKKDKDGNIERIEVEKPNQINNTNPAWVQKPANLKEEDYSQFYRELYPYTFEEPLFHIHLNVDYPFNLTGILYFPKLKENIEVQKNKINLYCNQVFISDNVAEIVPEFLTLLHGVIDSPDIPLNVSRSYLQSDGNVKKISSHITKKVAAKLEEMFNADRANFEQKWPELKVFVEYGMLTNDAFEEKAKSFSLLQNTENQFYTIADYIEKVKVAQTDKNNKIVLLYTHDSTEHYGLIKSAKERGYDVLQLSGPLVSHWITKIEQAFENISFVRVDADALDKLIAKNDEISSKLSEEESKKLQELFEQNTNKEKYRVVLENADSREMPVLITQPEFIRRMQEQQRMGGGMGMYGMFPEIHNIVVNKNNEKVIQILQESDANKQAEKIKQLISLALLSKGLLAGEELDTFIKSAIEKV